MQTDPNDIDRSERGMSLEGDGRGGGEVRVSGVLIYHAAMSDCRLGHRAKKSLPSDKTNESTANDPYSAIRCLFVIVLAKSSTLATPVVGTATIFSSTDSSRFSSIDSDDSDELDSLASTCCDDMLREWGRACEEREEKSSCQDLKRSRDKCPDLRRVFFARRKRCRNFKSLREAFPRSIFALRLPSFAYALAVALRSSWRASKMKKMIRAGLEPATLCDRHVKQKR